jgi:hypothetical protein
VYALLVEVLLILFICPVKSVMQDKESISFEQCKKNVFYKENKNRFLN